MPQSCTAADLLAASKCLCGIPSGKRELVMIYLLQQLAGLGNLTAAQLLDRAKCFCSLSDHDMKAIEVALLCTATGGVPPCPPSGGGGPCPPCPQDMQVAWTPPFAMGEALGMFASQLVDGSGNVYNGPLTFSQKYLVEGFSIGLTTGLTTLSFPNLLAIDPNGVASGSLTIGSNSALTSISAPLLATIRNSLDIDSNPVLGQISLPLLVSIAAGATLNDNILATLFSLPSLASLDYIYAPNNTALTSVVLTSLTSAPSGINFNTCPSLSSISLPAYVPTDGSGIRFDGCALNATSEQQLLRRCVLAGVTTCTIRLDGGTNAAISTLNAQGQADAATLGAQLTANP